MIQIDKTKIFSLKLSNLFALEINVIDHPGQ